MYLRHPLRGQRPHLTEEHAPRSPETPRQDDTLRPRDIETVFPKRGWSGVGRGCRCDAWLWCGAVVVTATAAVALLHRNPRLSQTRIPKEPNAAVAMRHTNGTNALQPEPGPPPTQMGLPAAVSKRTRHAPEADKTPSFPRTTDLTLIQKNPRGTSPKFCGMA